MDVSEDEAAGVYISIACFQHSDTLHVRMPRSSKISIEPVDSKNFNAQLLRLFQ